MDAPSDVSPTSHPLMHDHMTNSDTDSFNHNMDSMHTMSQSDMESMMHEHHRMRRGTEAVTSPTMRDSDTDKNERFTPQSVFTVKPMKRYRFRIISNGVNNCPIQFSIDSHNLTMIASDGSAFKPLEVQSFNIFAGERYDFVLHTNNHVGNYWVRTRGLADCEFKLARQTAILRYQGSVSENPSESTDYENFNRKGMVIMFIYIISTNGDMCIRKKNHIEADIQYASVQAILFVIITSLEN